ncbi:MAG: hypothetical protein EOP53_17415 [Sphingobacteriales bacterium]|nr:MAG: hypothetical protein EOP53_17415 [Sphingobacteriales bacterium]
MGKLAILLVLILALMLGYAMHKLIRRFINPKTSVNHLFLFFLAHFVGIFIMVFLINLIVLKFAGFLFQS